MRDERKTADQEMGTIKLKKSIIKLNISATIHEGQRIGLFVREAQTHSFFLGASSTSLNCHLPTAFPLLFLNVRGGGWGYSL